MPRKSFQVYPGRGLGALYLGACLPDVMACLKGSPKEDEDIVLTYSPTDPATTSILVNIPRDGLRLRFDGPEQRLRLIEVLDFAKASINYKGHEVYKSTGGEGPVDPSASSFGPTYRSLTKLLGPTFPGEYLAPHSDEGVHNGTYILSYPGVAFSFPVDASKWSSDPENASTLMTSSAMVATTMAVYEGRTWNEARKTLFSATTTHPGRRRSSSTDTNDVENEIRMVKVHGEGRLELVKRSGSTIALILSQTTPQDLISDLGAPDAIYHKDDRRLAIHQTKPGTANVGQGRSTAIAGESEDENPAMSFDDREIASAEHFYNYFRFGIDILIGQPAPASMPSPTVPESKTFDSEGPSYLPKNHLTAIKVVIHGNVPGAWDFDRYHRCPWSIEHVPTAANMAPLNSEDKFSDISERLKEVFSTAYASKEEARAQQRAMALDRSWDASPDSSCELLGGWEEDLRDQRQATGGRDQRGSDMKSELFGYPGMIFEVLPNGVVSCLTIY